MFELEFFPAQRSIWFRVFAVRDKVQVFGVGRWELRCDLEASPLQQAVALIDLRTITPRW